MTRSALVAVSSAFLLLSTALGGCSKVLYAPMYQTGTVSHVVVCTLKNRGNDADRQKLIKAARAIREIPGIYDIAVGTAIPSDRPVVASDYDVAFVMIFRDRAALNAYESHPDHQKAVRETLAPLTSKIVVYDILNQEY
jgi:hypothetical protein